MLKFLDDAAANPERRVEILEEFLHHEETFSKVGVVVIIIIIIIIIIIF